MQTKVQLIYNDVCTVWLFGFLIYRNNELKSLWSFLFVYFLIKQIIAHRENYKLNNRLY